MKEESVTYLDGLPLQLLQVSNFVRSMLLDSREIQAGRQTAKE